MGGPPGSAEEDGDRYIEIWNVVFMQFNRQADGTMLPLPKPSVDTGMGLERITAVLQHVNSNYDIDIFRRLVGKAAEITGTSDLKNKSLNVIADHIRSCAYLIADGVMPSNEGRGYVLRRIIRRAVRHGHLLGAKGTFFYQLVPTLIEVMAEAGNELETNQALIEKLLRQEEEQFARTLERGLVLLDEALAKVENNLLSGEVVFKLYDTYGFPYDLTADICREKNITIDQAGFDRAMEAQRQQAQAASNFGVDYGNLIAVDGETGFEGYTSAESLGRVTALFHDGKEVERIQAGQSAVVVLDNTPFYGESGGQIGDTGRLESQSAVFSVQDTQKYGKVFGHIGELAQGELAVGQSMNAVVDSQRRTKISLNHSATHLLHAALREILGTHVNQKGSLVSDSILRFDFAQPEAISKVQLNEIEDLVNQQIRANNPIVTEIMDLEAAKAKGAMALFGEKYSEQVRVLSMGEFSTELCGGIHAARTGDIGLFKIISEGAIAAGIRRIEAVTGANAIDWLHQQQAVMQQSADLLKADANSLVEKIQQLQERNKRAEKELQLLKEKAAQQAGNDLAKQTQTINGVQVVLQKLDGVEAKSLRIMVDDLKNQLGSAVIAFASVTDGKVNLIAGVTEDLTAKIKAGELVNLMAQQVGGKGGGRPDLAMAGGAQIENVAIALATAKTWLENQL